MTIQTSTLRPGLLVSLSCTVTGNVKYRKSGVAYDIADDGAEIAAWTTQREIKDVAEHKAASKARADSRNAVTAACTHSAFGLLCPESNADKLESAIAKAREIAARFNESATLSRLNVYVITGRIAPDDVEAVRAINSEIRGLLTTMATGLQNLDSKVVREAANKARGIGAMLSPDAESRVKDAIALARKAARKIQKAGTQGAIEIDRATVAKIAESRIAFLDIDGPMADVATPVESGRALDLSPADDIAPVTIRAASYDMEG